MRSVLAVLVLWLQASLAPAEQISVSTQNEPLPAQVSPALKPLFADAGARVTIGKTTIDFWWIRLLPLEPVEPIEKAGSTSGWNHVKEGALVGAARLAEAYKDIRGRTIKPGTYTLRYGIQPENGDHLGVSPHRDFLLISPAESDSAPEPLGHDATVELAKRTVGISHPAVWSLDPPVAAVEPHSVHTNGSGHQAVIFEVPLERAGKPAGTLRFGVILVGKIEA